MSGHGHVTPNPDGWVARCGGPAICSQCHAELAAHLARLGPVPTQTTLSAKEEAMRMEHSPTGWCACGDHRIPGSHSPESCSTSSGLTRRLDERGLSSTPEPGMNGIGWAVKQMRNGLRVRRAGWDGKGMFLELVQHGGFDHPSVTRLLAPFVVMFTAHGDWVPWLCSQADLLATDWETVEVDVSYDKPLFAPNT
jgi:hypothetical protein